MDKSKFLVFDICLHRMKPVVQMLLCENQMSLKVKVHTNPYVDIWYYSKYMFLHRYGYGCRAEGSQVKSSHCKRCCFRGPETYGGTIKFGFRTRERSIFLTRPCGGCGSKRFMYPMFAFLCRQCGDIWIYCLVDVVCNLILYCIFVEQNSFLCGLF